jgi:hypothetical protein
VDAPIVVKRVFVTSTTTSGAIGGLLAADSFCQARANAAALPGAYMAWLSDATDSPSRRMTRHSGPYVLTNGTRVADDWADLTDGSLRNPIDVDELGRASTLAGCRVWTNTTTFGGVKGAESCEKWSSNLALSMGAAGVASATNATWTEGCGGVLCVSSLALYCFEQ